MPRPAVPVERIFWLDYYSFVSFWWRGLVKGYGRTTGDEDHFSCEIGDVFGWVEGRHCAKRCRAVSMGITQ